MTFLSRTSIIFILLPAFVLMEGCSPFNNLDRITHDPTTFVHAPNAEMAMIRTESPYIKLHLKNGAVVLMNDWETYPSRRTIEGKGVLYSPLRDTLGTGQYAIGTDSVSIIETNRISHSGTQTALTVFIGITGIVAAFCITNPKACFGSCPTFYAVDADTLRPRAEGFSASIAPSLEATDVDALGDVPSANNRVTIEMRNEALETHVVRTVNLLAVPKHAGSTIYQESDGSFLECEGLHPPLRAKGDEGGCLDLIAASDGRERMSRADSTDLAAKETIDLTFDRGAGDTCGLVIGCRQSLMTTFLFYKTLGFMGRDAGQWFAEMDRNSGNEPIHALEETLGGIDVSVMDTSGAWIPAGTVLEYGPLATDVHILPLPSAGTDSLRIRLTLTKGYWRIDHVGLTHIAGTAAPMRIQPSDVERDGVNDPVALAMLTDSARTLVTMPGDTYRMHFTLPDRAERYGLFLESRGYYLEWIRKSWLDDEDPLALAQILFDPAEALRRLAPEFARSERRIETQFWNSKYAPASERAQSR